MLVLITDAHFDPNDSNGKQITYQGHTFSSRLLDKITLYKKAVDFAIENKAHYFVDAGDTINQLNPPEWIRDWIKTEILLPLIDNQIQTYFIAGNHGTEKVSTAFQSFHKFNPYFRFVYDTFVDIVDFRLIPFVPLSEEAKLKDWLNDCPKKIITHLSVSGAVGNNGFILDGFSPDLFKQQTSIYSGHFHRPQKHHNVVYIGSMATNKWNEINNKHYFCYYNFDDKKMRFQELEDRKFVVIESIEGMEKVVIPKDSVVQLKITATKSEFAKFPKTDVIKSLYDKGAYLVKYQPVVINTEAQKKVNNVSSMSNLIMEYAKNDPKKVQVANHLLYME